MMQGRGAFKKQSATGGLFALVMNFSGALVAPSVSGAQTLSEIEQKLVFAARLIERLPADKRGSLLDELESLQGRFLDEDPGLADSANALLKNITTLYRKNAEKRPTERQSEFQQKFMERRRELDAFREAFDLVSVERPDSAAKALDLDSFEKRISLADELAVQSQFQDAYSSLDGAYHQLIFALKRLRDNETVTYALNFANAAEEYSYESRRYRSQEILLQMFTAENPPSEDTAKKLAQIIDSAQHERQSAELLAKQARYEDALAVQEDAVAELTKAMRLVGFYF